MIPLIDKPSAGRMDDERHGAVLKSPGHYLPLEC